MAQHKNIDIVPDETITRVHLSQGDIGRTLIFYLFENALSWSVPASSTIKCQGTKPSGFGFSVSCTYSGNAVTCVTTDEMTDEYGQIEAELVITSSDESQVFGTSNFILDIERNPHPDGTVDGDAENPVIANLNAVITQAVNDWLDEHPEATTTVQDGSITEPKLASALATKINNKVDTSALTNEATARADADTALSNQIAALQGAVGSPLVASTVAGMTDTTKIYVYTGTETNYTAGDWYYYDDSAWVSGGVYNAVAVNTDTTLSVSGMAADAEAVGRIVREANKTVSIKQGIYIRPGDTLTVGAKWPDSGSAVSDTKYIRGARITEFAQNKAICLENTDYVMTIGAYTSSSGTVTNYGSRITINAYEKFIIPTDWTYTAVNFYRVDGSDVTSTDATTIRSCLYVYDSVEIENYFTKNLIGNIPNVLYPIHLLSKQPLTIATSDGSAFDGTIQLQILDENKTQIDYWGLTSGLTSRTIYHPASKATGCYARINNPSPVPLVLRYGAENTEYSEYFPTNKALNDYDYLGSEQNKVRVCAWNVGNFAFGDAGDGAGTDAMYWSFIKAFQEINADVYLFSEWDQYWNLSNTVLSSDKLGALKPYWSSSGDNTQGRYAYQKIASNFPIVWEKRTYYADGENRHFVDIIHNIRGKAVHFISTHLPCSSTSLRDTDVGILQDYIENLGAEYYVIGGDFNSGLDDASSPATSADMYALLDHDRNIWTNEGYNSAQGTFWGNPATNLYINTGTTAASSIYPVRAYDNVVTSSNIKIINAFTIDSDASDHYPLIVDILLID